MFRSKTLYANRVQLGSVEVSKPEEKKDDDGLPRDVEDKDPPTDASKPKVKYSYGTLKRMASGYGGNTNRNSDN